MEQTTDYSQDFGFRLFDHMNKECEVGNPNALAGNSDLQLTWPIRLMEYAQSQRKLIDAVMVVINTPHIQAYLRESDPRALQQCLSALGINERTTIT
jgi:hypothetical protein